MSIDWQYTGDINSEYGGLWLNLDAGDYQHGYVNAVRITDLSDIGFDGAVLIERLTVVLPRNKCEMVSVLSVYDCGIAELANKAKINRVQMIAEACVAYGLYDPASSYHDPDSETLQLDAHGDMEFDGWKADRKQPRGDLDGYIRAKYLA